MSATPVRAAIYARLSSAQNDKDEADQSDSVENQLADLRAMAAKQGYTVIDEFVDDGISGYKLKTRAGFGALLAAIADGKLDLVLARHADRLERNEHEGYQLRVASVRGGVRWQFSSGMTVDPATAEGGLLAKILSAISEFESAVKTARLVQHYAGRRLSGTFQAPSGTFGYDGPELVEWEAELIREAYRTVDEGGTIFSIYKKWNEQNVPQRKRASQGGRTRTFEASSCALGTQV